MGATSSAAFADKPGFHVPQRSSLVAMWLFLLSLAVLFVAGMLLYVIFRFTGRLNPSLGTISFPPLLWVSTLLVLLGSVTIHRALTSIRRERRTACRNWLLVTLAIAFAFVVTQAPPLLELLDEHRARIAAESHPLFGVIFFLILLHALHVLGGIVALVIVCAKSLNDVYDHESHLGVRFSAMYWHFLDGVWLVMFGTMFLFG